MDRGAWQAAVHRVTNSWTRLKQLGTHTGRLFYSLQMTPNIISHLNLTTTSKIRYYSSYIIDEETEG